MNLYKNLIYILISTFIAFFSLIGCNKESDTHLKSFKLSNELELLYEDVPKCDFGNITLINGDILRFENEDHYYYVYENLVSQYESWSDIFFAKYNSENEYELDSIIAELGFDDRIPLLLFEEKYGILDNNLRSIWVNNEKEWLDNGATGNLPVDQLINCPIEQALYSKYHEVCVGDTIYQMRADGIIIIIPISEIEHLQDCRTAITESELLELTNAYPRISINKSIEACYKKYYSKSGQQHHSEVGEAKFEWSYNYGPNYNGHKFKTTVSMRNYEKKNGVWDRTRAICALGLSSSIYSYMIESEACSRWGPHNEE
jgi:hypothetical protein